MIILAAPPSGLRCSRGVVRTSIVAFRVIDPGFKSRREHQIICLVVVSNKRQHKCRARASINKEFLPLIYIKSRAHSKRNRVKFLGEAPL